MNFLNQVSDSSSSQGGSPNLHSAQILIQNPRENSSAFYPEDDDDPNSLQGWDHDDNEEIRRNRVVRVNFDSRKVQMFFLGQKMWIAFLISIYSAFIGLPLIMLVYVWLSDSSAIENIRWRTSDIIIMSLYAVFYFGTIFWLTKLLKREREAMKGRNPYTAKRQAISFVVSFVLTTILMTYNFIMIHSL